MVTYLLHWNEKVKTLLHTKLKPFLDDGIFHQISVILKCIISNWFHRNAHLYCFITSFLCASLRVSTSVSRYVLVCVQKSAFVNMFMFEIKSDFTQKNSYHLARHVFIFLSKLIVSLLNPTKSFFFFSHLKFVFRHIIATK